jgi:hypothetical protein
MMVKYIYEYIESIVFICDTWPSESLIFIMYHLEPTPGSYEMIFA